MGTRKSRPERQPLLREEEIPVDPQLAKWDAEQRKLVSKVKVVPRSTGFAPRTVAGVDVSYGSGLEAAVSIVVLDVDTHAVIASETHVIRSDMPYVPGYLGIREVPLIAPLVRKYRPDAVLVDGNGRLHPRRFGAACHLGVVCNVPTVGVGKKLHTFGDVPPEKEVRRMPMPVDLVDGGEVLGRAFVPTAKGTRPIYVSPGHDISLVDAVQLVHKMCVHRVPEPIRFADASSREALRKRGLL